MCVWVCVSSINYSLNDELPSAVLRALCRATALTFQITATYVFYIPILINLGDTVDITCSSQNLLIRSCSFIRKKFIAVHEFYAKRTSLCSVYLRTAVVCDNKGIR